VHPALDDALRIAATVIAQLRTQEFNSAIDAISHPRRRTQANPSFIPPISAARAPPARAFFLFLCL